MKLKTQGHELSKPDHAPNGNKIADEKAGVAVTDRGFINVDIQMRTNVPHIFASGDIVGQPMLAHKALWQRKKMPVNSSAVRNPTR